MGCIASKKQRAHKHTDLAGAKESAWRGSQEADPLLPPAYDATSSNGKTSLDKAFETVIDASEKMCDDMTAIMLLAEAGKAATTGRMAAQIYALLKLRVAQARKNGNSIAADDLARPVLEALEDRAKQPTLQPTYLAQLARAAESAMVREAAEWEEE